MGVEWGSDRARIRRSATRMDSAPQPSPGDRVPLAELVDLEALSRAGRPPSPAEIRAALPPGWVPDEDGVSARRDLRLLFRRGWILVAGMVSFGAVAIGLFWQTFPAGWRGVGRALVLVVVIALIGGVVGPMITRALHRK